MWAAKKFERDMHPGWIQSAPSQALKQRQLDPIKKRMKELISK